MRYRLRTLVLLTAIGPPFLAGLWFLAGSVTGMIGWAVFAGLFGFWYWQLCLAQAMHPRMRGYPNYDPPPPAAGV